MSDTARKAFRNTALLVAFEIANPLMSLFLIGTLTRRLGAEGLGGYNLLLNFFFVVHAFTSLGLNPLITREVSRDRSAAGRFLCTSASFGLLVAAVAALVLVATIHAAGYGGDVRSAAWLVGGSLLPSIVILYSESILIAYEKIQFIVWLALGENLGKVLVGLWLLHRGYGVMALIASFTVFRYLNLAFNLLVFHRQVAPLKWTYDPGVARELVRSAPVFGTILVVATLRMRVDVFLLSKMANLAAIGYYTAASRLYEIAAVVPKSLYTSIYPVFSRLFKGSPDSFRKANSLSIRYIMVALLPVAAGTHGLAEPLVRLLFGWDFGPAAPALKIVIWSLVPYGLGRVLVSRLFASDRQHIDLKVNVIALAANVALNLVLIPRYGFLGCAWGTLLSTCLFLVCQCYFLRDEILPVLHQAEILKPALAAAAILLWLRLTPALPLPMRIAGGAAVYGALLFLLQAVRMSELRLMLPERFVALLPEERKP